MKYRYLKAMEKEYAVLRYPSNRKIDQFNEELISWLEDDWFIIQEFKYGLVLCKKRRKAKN